jgi:hypothetical protein
MAIFRDYRRDELRIARVLQENLGHHATPTCLFRSGLAHFSLLDIVLPQTEMGRVFYAGHLGQ